MFVSGSRLRIKRLVHQAAAQIKVKGARLISLTDSNDRELVDRSEMAILAPPLSEVGGSMLALALLELLATQLARNVDGRGSFPRKRESTPQASGNGFPLSRE
jgi:DNA-binding MurR/RpiR family transcriptional regulator